MPENQSFCGKRQRTMRAAAVMKISVGMAGETSMLGKIYLQMKYSST